MSRIGISLDLPHSKLLMEYADLIEITDDQHRIDSIIKLTLEKYIPQLAKAIEPSPAHKLFLSPSPMLMFEVPDGGEIDFSLDCIQQVRDKIAHVIHPHIDLFWLAMRTWLETVREIEVYPNGLCTVYGSLSVPEPFCDYFTHITLKRDTFLITEIKKDQRTELQGERANLPERFEPLVHKCWALIDLPTWLEFGWMTSTKDFRISFHTRGEEEE